MKVFFLIFIVTSHAMAQQKTVMKFLALGDSYTIGESVNENERWPVQLVNRLVESGKSFAPPKIIATTGWRTDDLQRAIAAADLKNDYDLVSLLIGVNNQYQGKPPESYRPEFEALLKTAIALAGSDPDKVFVVSIPDYGFTPFGKDTQERISRELDKYNQINKEISEKYRVKYFNITDISRRGFADPQLVAADGLHPSGKMYSLWVDVILHGLFKK